jgi:hypothetical protein
MLPRQYSATAWGAPNQECKTLRSKGSETEVSKMLKGPSVGDIWGCQPRRMRPALLGRPAYTSRSLSSDNFLSLANYYFAHDSSGLWNESSGFQSGVTLLHRVETLPYQFARDSQPQKCNHQHGQRGLVHFPDSKSAAGPMSTTDARGGY